MSLADSLLADLDGLSDDEDPSPPPQPIASSSKGSMLPPPLPSKLNGNGTKRPAEDEGDEDEDMKLENVVSAVGFVPEGGVRPADELDAEEVENTDLAGVEDVGKVARLMMGKKLKEVLSVSYWAPIEFG
jgi:U4/U6 small nuclear ribonucleoprotein PRP31